MYLNLSEAKHNDGELAVAVSAGAAALKITQHLTGLEPENTAWLFGLAISHFRLGAAIQFQKDYPGAEPHLQEFGDIMKRLVARDPNNKLWLSYLAYARTWQGANAGQLGEWARSSGLWAEQIETYERILALSVQDHEARRRLADGLNQYALALGRQHRHAEAVAMLTRALQILEQLETDGKLSGQSLSWPANVRTNLIRASELLGQQQPPETTKP